MIARCSIALALLLFSFPALAQDARALFRRGVEALRAERYADAERAFLASYEASPHIATLCNLAVTYDEWPGHAERAAETYERCADADDEGRYREHARDRARALRAELEAASPREPSPPSEPSPPEPAEAPLPPEQAASPFVDPPPATTPSVDVPVTDHSPRQVESRSHGLLIVGSIVAATGAGLTGTGAFFAGRSRETRDELDARHPGDEPVVLPRGSEDAQQLEDARRDRRVAIGLYAGGAGLGVLGATLIVLDLVQPSPTQIAATPIPGGAMVVARLRLPR